MLIKFSGPRVIGGKNFQKGTHEVSDEFYEHWFTQGLIKSGDIIVVKAPEKKLPPAPSLQKAEEGKHSVGPAKIPPSTAGEELHQEIDGEHYSPEPDLVAQEAKSVQQKKAEQAKAAAAGKNVKTA